MFIQSIKSLLKGKQIVLIDLDEFILQCRSNRAKNYIREAVAAYKVGAFRACIISVWIAVVFDVIEKFKRIRFEWRTVRSKGAQRLGS